MPIKASAKKALRQNIKRRKKNREQKNRITSLKKTLRTLLVAQKKEEASRLLPQIYKALDKAAKGHAIKKNTASRKKSRIAKLVKKSFAPPTL